MKDEALPPFWVDLHLDAQEELTRAKEILSILQKTQQKRLLCILNDDAMKKSEIEVDSLTVSVCNSFKRIEKLAQSISNLDTKPSTRYGTSSNINSNNFNTLKKNAEISIANELNPLSQQFKHMQKNYVSELQNNYFNGLEGNQIHYEDSQVRKQIFDQKQFILIFRNII